MDHGPMISQAAPAGEPQEALTQAPRPEEADDPDNLLIYKPAANPKEKVSKSVSGFLQTCLDEDAAAPVRPWDASAYSYLDLVESKTPARPQIVVMQMELPLAVPMDQNPNAFAAEVLAPHGHFLVEAVVEGDVIWTIADFVRANSQIKILAEEADHACPVCWEELRPGGQVRELPCRHMCHGECFEEWFQRPGARPECPGCHALVVNHRAVGEHGQAQAALVPVPGQ